MEATHALLNVPTVISYPSLRSLQWSPDGQACFVTKSAAYILTPEPGILFDNYSTVKSANEKDAREGAPPIRWFRTMIPFEKADAFKWPEYSQAWGAASLGSIDVALLDAVFSPSGVSPDSGCILAALSSNMDLTLWKASKNFLKGEWIKICDVTPYLLDTVVGDIESAGDAGRVLESQITSIDWSQQPDFGYAPAPFIDASLLVAGSRAGSITFLRYQIDEGVNRLDTISLSQSWITRSSFAPWTIESKGKCTSLLAYSTADGAVGLVKVTQTLEHNGAVSEADLKLSLDFVDENVVEPDRSGVTALTWVELAGGKPILVWCKPGRLFIWCGPSTNLPWSGLQSFKLPLIKLSVGSSPFHPATGLAYAHDLDALVVTLYDGSFHLLRNISHAPTFDNINENDVNSALVSQVARGVFLSSEAETGFNDMNRVAGAACYDGFSTFLWVQEASRPADFSYKHDAKQNSTLVVASLWNSSDEAFMTRLAHVLEQSHTVHCSSSYALLRPFYLRLRDKRLCEDLLPSIVNLLQNHVPDHSSQLVIPQFSTSGDSHSHFRDSLKQHLFGWDSFLSLRLRFALTEVLQVVVDDASEEYTNLRLVSRELLTAISHRVLRTIIRHLAGAIDVLTDQDVPFLLRMVVQTLLPGSPSDLSAEGNELRRLAEHLLPQETATNAEINLFNERCPACRVEVPLNNISVAICPNGHSWGRCSITTFILSTASVRTCVGCRRKAFLASRAESSEGSLPPMARGWVVQELLQAVDRCLFCNNRFVSVL